MKKLFILLLITITTYSIQAQILNGVMRKAKNRLENKVEDKLAEELADAIYNSIYDDIDSMYYEEYKRDSISGDADGSYNDFLKRLSEGVDLPESYTFDYQLTMEVKEEKEDPKEFDYLFADGQSYFGMLQEKENSLIIYDHENELIAVYNLDKKEVQTLPSMNSFASAYIESEAEEYVIHTFEKTGKSKNIIGYNCTQYRYESDQMEGTTYIAQDFPINWKDNFGEMMKQYSPQMRLSYGDADGMMLEGESTDKETKKKTTSIVKNFEQEKLEFKSADYKKTSGNKQ